MGALTDESHWISLINLTYLQACKATWIQQTVTWLLSYLTWGKGLIKWNQTSVPQQSEHYITRQTANYKKSVGQLPSIPEENASRSLTSHPQWVTKISRTLFAKQQQRLVMNFLTKTLKTITKLTKQVRPSISFAKGRSGIQVSINQSLCPFYKELWSNSKFLTTWNR